MEQSRVRESEWKYMSPDGCTNTCQISYPNIFYFATSFLVFRIKSQVQEIQTRNMQHSDSKRGIWNAMSMVNLGNYVCPFLVYVICRSSYSR